MNVDLINAELQTVAFMQQEEQISLTYQDFLGIINTYYDAIRYESDSYDLDAFYYGVN
jgi:hypothetical protein